MDENSKEEIVEDIPEPKPKLKPKKKLKGGSLATEEITFIIENCTTMSVEEIAIHLNRNPDTVRKRMAMHGLANKDEKRHEMDRIYKEKLHSESFWPDLEHVYTKDELRIFEQHWINLMNQFQEDVIYSEKTQIIDWITFQILRTRILREKKELKEKIEELEKLLTQEQQKSAIDKDYNTIQMLYERISSARAAESNQTKEHNELYSKQEKITNQLKASRSDRIKNIQDASQNWLALLNLFYSDDEVRTTIGQDFEIMREAKEREKMRLSNYHTYEDKEVDQPILTPETTKD